MLIWRLEKGWVVDEPLCFACGGTGQTSKYTTGMLAEFVNAEVEHE